MSFGNIIGGLLKQGLSSQSHNRLKTGSKYADQRGGIEQMLGSMLRGQNRSLGSGGMTGKTGGMSSTKTGGMSSTKAGGLGALAGTLMGGGVKGAAKGGAMAVLGTLALQAWREHQSQSKGAPPPPPEPTTEEVDALTSTETEWLVLQAMIGAAQVDGHVDEAEMDKILGHMHGEEVTEEERRATRAEVHKPVDMDSLGARISRPEVATEVYLGALMAVDIDTEAERDYFRRLARALRLQPDVVQRLHRMTGAPSVS